MRTDDIAEPIGRLTVSAHLALQVLGDCAFKSALDLVDEGLDRLVHQRSDEVGVDDLDEEAGHVLAVGARRTVVHFGSGFADGLLQGPVRNR